MAERKLIVASSKGGVGKSTVALGVASSLNALGHTVLLCDFDLENRCLDLFLGAEDETLFNVSDVASGKVPPRRALLKNDSGLWFLAAPGKCDGEYGAEELTAGLKAAVEEVGADFTVFDTGTAHGIPAAVAKAFPGSEALIVSSHQATAMRGAERMAEILSEAGVKKSSLVICGYELKEAKKTRSGLLEIIDTSGVPLVGVVPYDRELLLSHERGKRVPKGTPAASAFDNIARRLLGEKVRLFEGTGPVNRKKIV